MADMIANIIVIVVTVATAAAAIYLARPLFPQVRDKMKTSFNHFQGWLLLWGQYLFRNQIVEKIKAMGKFKGKSKDIQPFSHLDSLPGIQYELSEDFVYFRSTKRAYDELFETLEDNSIHMIGLYGEGGSGKTTLVTEVGKKAEDLEMFDKVISITVSRTPNIRAIQGKIADMLKLKLGEESEEGRAQRLWTCLKQKRRILIIVDSLWREFKLKDIGIHLDDDIKKTWKILITTRHERVCTLMDCQKKIHLELLSEDESWNLFQKFARIDDERSKVLDDVPRKICNECMRLPIAIKIVGSLFKERKEIEWKQAFQKLRDSKASDDEDNATLCVKLSYDYLPTKKAQQIFLLCALFPEEYHIPTEDLVRYALGLGVREISSLQSMRSSISTVIKELLDSCLLTCGSMKMDNTVRDAALWIANRSDDCKILVNVDKPFFYGLQIRDCFAVSSWWYNDNPFFYQLYAPNLKILLININAHDRSLDSLDLSHFTFEGIQGLEVFSITINYKIVPISFPPSIQLLTNVRTLRLNGLTFGDISFITSLTRLEVLDLRRCKFNELPIEIGNCISLKLLDMSECQIFEENYNGAIGKCSQLEELYASECNPEEYVHEIILDIGILLNLQRFVLGDPIIPESTKSLRLSYFDISKLSKSNKNILQIAETISLCRLLGGSKNIIPDMTGLVGGMNNLSTLHLTDCGEIECFFNATCDFKEDDLIPKLVELRLESMGNLRELCHGPPLQVLHYFERLELLYIHHCWSLHIIFPSECKLRNLKILSLSYCMTDEVLFSESVAQSMQKLEQLTIESCDELKHIIGCNENCQAKWPSQSLRILDIQGCPKLAIPWFNLKVGYDQSQHHLNQIWSLQCLQSLTLAYCEELKYLFSMETHRSLPELMYISVSNCQELEQIVAANEELVELPNAELYFPKLKQITVFNCHKLKSLFPLSVAQSLQQLEQLKIRDCSELKHIIAASGSETRGRNTSEEIISVSLNSHFLMNSLRDVGIFHCPNLESIFPICYVEGLAKLQQLQIAFAPKLEYVFGECDHECLSSHQNHVMLPHLEVLKLSWLDNLVGMCPENCQAKWPSQSLRIIDTRGCPKLAIPWFNLKVGYDQNQHHLNEIWSLRCLQHLSLTFCKESKCLFSMETLRSLPELMYLSVSHCQELEQIVAANEELLQLPNGELYFPKLKQITVSKCHKLKSLFRFFMVTMLPRSKASQLQQIFRDSQRDGIMNEMKIVLPDLTEITLADLPNFVDICHGCKLHAVKLQKLSISNCPKNVSSLRIIQTETEEAAYVEEPFEPNFARDKGKRKEINSDFAVDKDETEEAWYMDKGKEKEIEKRIGKKGQMKETWLKSLWRHIQHK